MDNFFALIVGVGGDDLPETIKDAEAIRNVLISQGAYNPANVFFLVGSNSTKNHIVNAFDEVIKKTEEMEDSTVFIYYSGHGQRYETVNKWEYYLKTHGANEEDKENTMLNGDIFSEKVDNIKAKRVLVMLDCCYAGGVKIHTENTRGGKVDLSNRALQEKLKSGKGRVFISSCDDNETSVILPKSQNSLFTEVALEVLNGLFSPNSEYVSVLELIFHVLIKVPERIKKYGHNQNPVLTEAEDLNYKYYVCKNGKWQPSEKNKDTRDIKTRSFDNESKLSFIKNYKHKSNYEVTR